MSDKPNMFRDFSTQGILDALDKWSANERECQRWRDADYQTYRYRADLLEQARRRIADLEAEGTRLREHIADLEAHIAACFRDADCDLCLQVPLGVALGEGNA